MESHKIDVRKIIKERKDYYFEHIKAYAPKKNEVDNSNNPLLKMNGVTWEHIIGEFHFLYEIIGVLLDNIVKYDVSLYNELKEKIDNLDTETKYLREDGMKWVFQDKKQLMSETENKEKTNGELND